MKIFTGKVVKVNNVKTAVVAVDRVIMHPLYKKRFKRDRKYQVHDELGTKVGDVVKFVASKPFSKTKKWKVLEVVGDKKDTKKVVEKKQEEVKPVKVKTEKKGTK